MKKITILFSSFFALAILCEPFYAHAQPAPSVPKEINAGILSSIWYSSLSMQDGESMRIYAGIQNNSDTDITGAADFYVDETKISEAPFSLPTGSLKDVYVSWIASAGTHTIQVKLVSITPSDVSLVSYQSDKSTITVNRKITMQDVQTIADNTANTVVSSIDNAASTLAQKVESLKNHEPKSAVLPSENSSVIGNSVTGSEANISFKSASSTVSSIIKNPAGALGTAATSALNLALDGLAFLIRNWQWTLVGIFVLYLLFRFF